MRASSSPPATPSRSNGTRHDRHSVGRRRASMKGPEDDAGLAGKVAIVIGRRRGRRRHRQRPRGGDPAGPRRHQGRGLRPRQEAGGAHRRDDQGRGRQRRRRGLRRDQRGRLQAAGRRRGRSLGPARLPRQQCRHRQPRQRGRREARRIPSRDAGQRRDDVPALQARDPGDDQDRQGRLDRQHLVDLRAAAARPHDLFGVEGGGDRAQPGDGGRSRQGPHPGQLHLPRPDVHADGQSRQRHERRQPRPARARPRC